MGPMTLKFEFGRDFCIVHLPSKFRHSMFNHSDVIVLTNQQTNKRTDFVKNIHLALHCHDGGKAHRDRQTDKDIDATDLPVHALTTKCGQNIWLIK